MPTCSQAKIISNLEFDINQRIFNLINHDQEITTITRIQHQPNQQISINNNNNNNQHYQTARNYDENRYLKNKSKTEYPIQTLNTNRFAGLHRRSLAKQLNQFSHDELTITNYNLQCNRRLPAIGNVFVTRKETVPANFLYNSSYRNKSGGQTRSQRLSPNKLVNKTPLIDTEDNIVDGHVNSDVDSSWSSSSENLATRNSTDQDSQRENLQQLDFTKRYNSGLYSSLPKLALEIEQYDDTGSDHTAEEEKIEKRRFTITGAKRLLALASIRPSKTFHKELTVAEAEILKKYYEIIKPKVHITIPQVDDEDSSEDCVKETEIPILYDTGKINYDTFSSLEMFLTEYKSELTSGKFQIDYNLPGHNGFVLRNKETDATIKFPPHVHDTFVALAISINAKGNPNLDETHILKSINWNDTRHILAPKQTAKKQSKNGINEEIRKSIPTVNMDAIKELSKLVNSIIEPKLLKKVSESGVDLSSLPGGINFEMPPCQELDLNNDLYQQVNKNDQQGVNNVKLKNVVYKKLKDKVASTKVMWFSAPPVRKPLSVVFEYAGFDLTHEMILEEANKSLEGIGQIVEVEFVPRSVHFASVYIQNLWILTLNDKDAKYYTISHGIEINGQKVTPKSYDEYIYTEYEKYIRTEKYKQMIKSHEKSMNNHNKINNNKK